MHPDARTRGAIPAQGVGGHPRRITVIGTGYVGLMTGATLAQLGHQVICLDVDDVKVDRLRRHRRVCRLKGNRFASSSSPSSATKGRGNDELRVRVRR
jgi:ketopantoate reductase